MSINPSTLPFPAVAREEYFIFAQLKQLKLMISMAYRDCGSALKSLVLIVSILVRPLSLSLSLCLSYYLPRASGSAALTAREKKPKTAS